MTRRLCAVLAVLGALATMIALASAPTASSASGPTATARAAAGTHYSQLKLGGRLVAYVYWNPSTNTFQVTDAYPDGQSAVVRFRVGKSNKTYSRWNSGGDGTSTKPTISAGQLQVRFRACRADRTEGIFQCAKTWQKAGSSCLKGSAQKVYKASMAKVPKGICITVTGEVLRGEAPFSGWAYRMKGQINDTLANGKNSRMQVRTHRVGEGWGKPVTIVSTGDKTWKRYDQVVHRGGYAFYVTARLCTKSGCGPWLSEEGRRVG